MKLRYVFAVLFFFACTTPTFGQQAYVSLLDDNQQIMPQLGRVEKIYVPGDPHVGAKRVAAAMILGKNPLEGEGTDTYFVRAVSAPDSATAGTHVTVVLQPLLINGLARLGPSCCTPVLLRAKQSEKDQARIIRSVSTHTKFTKSKLNPVQSEVLGVDDQKISFKSATQPDGSAVLTPSQPLEPGEYVLALQKPGTKNDFLDESWSFKVQ